MNQVQIFTKENLGQVRTVMLDDEPWFVAADICEILGIKNPSVAMKGLEDFERAKLNLGPPYGEVNIVSESGFYAMVIRSRKENAKVFRVWVTSEVLPSIRKNGKYDLESTEKNTEANYTEALKELGEKYDKIYNDMGKIAQLVIDMRSEISNHNDIVEESLSPNLGSMYQSWKLFVNDRVKAISKSGEYDSSKEVLHDIYEKMTRVYGVCWTQEFSDYKNKYNIEGRIYNMDVVWDKEMLRSIFNSILGGMIQNIESNGSSVDENKKYGDCDRIIRPLVEKRNDTSQYGCATFHRVYARMNKGGDINWKRAETRYVNKYGTNGMTRKLVVESSPTLMRKFRASVEELMAENG